jgi:hypothetical protein
VSQVQATPWGRQTPSTVYRTKFHFWRLPDLTLEWAERMDVGKNTTAILLS